MVNQRSNGDVEFRFFRPDARQVCLVGDFNDWNPSVLPMRKGNHGCWTCRLRLDPGVYRFQYLADGKRYLDFAAFGVERGPLGGWNSVVVVEERSKRVIPPQRAVSARVATVTGCEA